jgi:hypothetical protein
MGKGQIVATNDDTHEGQAALRYQSSLTLQQHWPFPITGLDYNCMRVSRLNDGELFGQSHAHVPTQSKGLYKISKKRTTIFCSLKKQTLQTFLIKKRTIQTSVVSKSRHYTFFVVSKSRHYNFVIKKADITDFCSPKKRILQIFLIKRAHTTNFCSLTWEAVG